MLYDDDYYDNSYDELCTYYPTYYKDVEEMQAILKAEGDMADGIKSGVERVIGDCYIDTSDEQTTAKRERFLHIHMHGDRSLADRKRLVKSYFVGAGKMSASLLSDIIGTYTGATSECRFEPCDIAGNNMVYIDSERGTETTFYSSDIIELIRAKLPAHLPFELNVVYRNECVVQNEIIFGYSEQVLCGQHLCGQGVNDL